MLSFVRYVPNRKQKASGIVREAGGLHGIASGEMIAGDVADVDVLTNKQTPSLNQFFGGF